MTESLYSHRSNFVLGFHGCDKSVVDKVVSGTEELHFSRNDYDWLGNGVYFWENNESRALQWAKAMSKRQGSKIKCPSVIGAIIDLGLCLDLTDSSCLAELRVGYDALVEMCKLSNIDLPQNSGKSKDKLIRKLDCAVIQTVHELRKGSGLTPYDSVKGVFWEGGELYPGSGFSNKNHIQICICNPNCIKGFFIPKRKNTKFTNP